MATTPDLEKKKAASNTFHSGHRVLHKCHASVSLVRNVILNQAALSLLSIRRLYEVVTIETKQANNMRPSVPRLWRKGQGGGGLMVIPRRSCCCLFNGHLAPHKSTLDNNTSVVHIEDIASAQPTLYQLQTMTSPLWTSVCVESIGLCPTGWRCK